MGPLDELTASRRVGATDADLQVVNNARYFEQMELARLEMMVRSGIFAVARREKWLPLTAAQTLRYKRPLRRFERFTLKSRVVCWDERWFFISHVFEREGKLVAAGLVRGCFRAKEGVVPPSEAFRRLGLSGESPAMPAHVAAWAAADEDMLAQTRTGSGGGARHETQNA
jgi:acyl-CoA thioesterase FadM